jgi:hypothetical protein
MYETSWQSLGRLTQLTWTGLRGETPQQDVLRIETDTHRLTLNWPESLQPPRLGTEVQLSADRQRVLCVVGMQSVPIAVARYGWKPNLPVRFHTAIYYGVLGFLASTAESFKLAPTADALRRAALAIRRVDLGGVERNQPTAGHSP